MNHFFQDTVGQVDRAESSNPSGQGRGKGKGGKGKGDVEEAALGDEEMEEFAMEFCGAKSACSCRENVRGESLHFVVANAKERSWVQMGYSLAREKSFP